MTKFKVGDVVERVPNVGDAYYFSRQVGPGPHVVTSVSPTGRWLGINGWVDDKGDKEPWHANNFTLIEQQDDPLPPAPERVMYVESDSPIGTDAMLLVKGSMYGGLLFELYAERKADGVSAYAGMRLDPDAALQLAHDLNRMANEIKRKEKRNA